MITLHITEVLAYFLKQHSIYIENCSKNFLFNFRENLWLTEGIYPFFHEAEYFFDIVTRYVSTTMALVPSQNIKMC